MTPPPQNGRRAKPLGRAMSALTMDELVDARNELEAQLHHYADLFDLAPVGFLTLTTHGIVKDINVAGAEILGQSRTNVLGQPLLVFFERPERARFLQYLVRLRREEHSPQRT